MDEVVRFGSIYIDEKQSISHRHVETQMDEVVRFGSIYIDEKQAFPIGMLELRWMK
jgi:hypothetical protein